MSAMKSPSDYLAEADPAFVKSLMRLLAGVWFVVVFVGLALLLPGAEQLVEPIPLTLGTVLMTIGTLVFVGVLIQMAPFVASVTERTLNNPDLAGSAGDIARNVVLFLAVIVAHRGLAPALGPLLDVVGIGGVYDIAFLILGILPLLNVAYHLYVAVDPLAALLTQSLTGVEPSGTDTPRVGAFDFARLPGLVEDVEAPTMSVDSFREAVSGDTTSASDGEPSDDRSVEPFGDVPPEFLSNEDRVLALLDAHDGRMQQTDVVAETGWSKSKVSRVLTQMEEEELIVRVNIGRGNVVTRPDDLPAGAQSRFTE